MKKLFFLSLLLFYHVGFSQQITLAQYWFGDNFAGRVPIVVSANANNEIIFDIEFPDNGTNELNEYFHCRFRDSDGNWSAIYSQQMSNNNDASTSQVKVQYWFDANSPIGRPEVTINNILVNGELDHQELDIPWPQGAQEIHYRFKSSYNKWSSIQTNTLDTVIYENNQIVKVEYWFGDGFANRGEPVAVAANTNNEIILNISYLDDGINQLDTMVHYRFLDGIGNWSCIYSEQMVTQNTSVGTEVKVQYWFDDNFNPNNTLQLLTNDTNGNQINSIPIVWETDAKTIHYRFKSKYNQWTSIQSSNIDEIENKNNQIVEAQWWLNNGFSTKTTIPVNHTGEVFLDIRDLTLDPAIQNTIHVRYKDKMNRWSSIFSFFPTEPGITVLVHGFQLAGELTDSTADFKKMGAEIIKRAGGGVMFVNNPDNGQIEFVDNNETDWSYPLNNKKEIVLVYDWRDLSNNLVVNIDFGSSGYLESAADNLLASILNIPNGLWGEAASLSKQQLLAKPKHFIAHSRGNIVTLQFLHRLATYFPESKVDQFTLLDPHPATSFGDLNTENPISPPNLPSVYGQAYLCAPVGGCYSVNFDTQIKIPSNVISSDNYFRRDEHYEGVLDGFAFDGLPVENLGLFNRELNNINLSRGAPIDGGGAHSAVHKWYRGTINTSEVVASPSLINTPLENTTNWYINGSKDMLYDFLQTESRFTTGFNRSRIGGGEPIPEIPNELKESLTEMNRSIALRYGLSLTDYPNGVHLHTVFGGYFDNSNDAGWNKNGGTSSQVSINNGKAQIYNDFVNAFATHSILKHSLMYFAPSYNFVRVNIYEASSNSTISYPSIKVTFFNHENVQIGSPYTKILSPLVVEQFIPLPNELKGEVGTFQIEYDTNTTGSFKVDEIKLVEFEPDGSCGDDTTTIASSEIININFWNNGLPDYSKNVTILHDLIINQDIEACSLTVDNGANVTVIDGKNIKLNGAIKVNSGTFTLENNASLIQNSTEFPNVGAITVKRNTNALMRLDYTMWSSPVENQALFSFSPYTLHNRFYTYNPNNNYYETVPFNANTTFADANGYLIRMPNNHPTVPTIWQQGQFTGVPHNGRFELNVTDGTYNAIGNPYPSPIKADLFIEENNLTEAIYFWRKTNNSLNPSYACYTLMGGIGTKANIGGGSDIVPNGIIQTGQGFIAKATSNKLTFTNAMRFANNENQFFRTNQEKSRIWLNLTNPNDFFCQTMIAYSPDATNEFDTAIDGHFLENEPTKLCSLIGNEEFVIQGRAPFEISDVVPLGFRSEIAGNFTIAIDNKDGLFVDGQEIYLKDNLLNTDHNLTTESYTFTTDSGVFNSRFEIHYQPTLSIQNTTSINNNVIVYKQNENIVIDSNRMNIINVKLFDIRGRLLLEKKNVTDKHIEFNLETANQVLIVKILTADELITTKKILN